MKFSYFIYLICVFSFIIESFAQEESVQDEQESSLQTEVNKISKQLENELDNNLNIIETDDGGDRMSLMKEWEDHMMDFIPDDMFSFIVYPKEIEVLEEQVDKPTTIRGAFFISMYSQDKIDFIVKDPEGQIVLTKTARKEAVFSANVTKVGTYQFIFSNKKGSDKQQMTFALDIHNFTQEHVQHTQLNEVEQNVQTLSDGVMDLYYETKFYQMRQDTGYESLSQTHNKLLAFTFFETGAILALTVWQIYHIKRIIDNRRLL